MRLFSDARKALKKTSKLRASQSRAMTSGAVLLVKGLKRWWRRRRARLDRRKRPPWLATRGRATCWQDSSQASCAGYAGLRGGERRHLLHGETGSEAGPGLIAEDLPEALRPGTGGCSSISASGRDPPAGPIFVGLPEALIYTAPLANGAAQSLRAGVAEW